MRSLIIIFTLLLGYLPGIPTSSGTIACVRGQTTVPTDETRPLVLASASIFADMAEVIAGGLLRVQSIVPIGGDPHIYEPTPADVQLVSRADLVLINGLTFEGWMNELIANSGTRANTVIITQGIGSIASEEYANSSDPHAWMTAKNGQTYARNIRDALIALDPANQDVYTFNAGIYLQQLEDLDAEIFQQIESIPLEKRVLITSHDAFRYYGRHYGIRVEAALGTSTDAEVRTEDVNRLTRIIRETGVPAIFVESTINPKLIRQIATDNGLIIGGSLYADSLADPSLPAGTYLGMLRHNTQTIVAALRGEAVDSGDGMGPSAARQGGLLAIILAVMLGAFFYMVRQLNTGA
ncbi:zinc ABC transporter substrate-binding protein [Neolewinella lacunae]|uniref:Zinc ABC transporter substrate-binding protein n=1 Tax=Neolewinella lacunae TaxID=1517758 RepID=A0A923PMY6_9BACT|nr:zinc ABC transporter substrate-binding protein [Neolewinella lacunae]MBC6995676.1 zinc ABC transporter substrate-binding protein [Neolewinella lacunae]MDN3636631.1 zinc ABC transporter substrate-binding protein [Neolewinella lacunae]